MTAPFNGLGMNLGNLSRLSKAVTRSICPENFTGAKGQGGMAIPTGGAARELGQGWKISPCLTIQPGQTFEMADIEGPGAIQQIWMTPTGNWRFSILRIYWDGQEQPAVECPVGDFFADGLGQVRPGERPAGVRQPGQRLQLLLGDALPQALPHDLHQHRHAADGALLPDRTTP